MPPDRSAIRLHALTAPDQTLRGEDSWGAGFYGAPRGEREHQGLDIVCRPGDTVLCPLDGDIIREAVPYDDEPRFSGLLIQGRGVWQAYEVKLFYLRGPHQGRVVAGEPLGPAEDLSVRYPGVTNHIHIEVRHNGKLIDPTPLLTESGA